MQYSENQKRLLAFCQAVRNNHGLDRFNFSKLIGANKSAYYDFENGDRPLGRRALQAIAPKLGITPQMIAACVDPSVPSITFPPPESVRLGEVVGSCAQEILIDSAKAEKIVALVQAAGKPIPLSLLTQLLEV